MSPLAGAFSPSTPRATARWRPRSRASSPPRSSARCATGLVAQGEVVGQAKLDVTVINSCHLITTFPTVVDGTPRHQGVLTAQEAPEIIHGVAYDYPGDYDLAARLIARGKAAGLQCVLANDVHYPLDYGTLMPMVCYLDRAQRTPIVPVSVCLSARSERGLRVGPPRGPGGGRERQAGGLRGQRQRLPQAGAGAREGAPAGRPGARPPLRPAPGRRRVREALGVAARVHAHHRGRDGGPAPGHDAGGGHGVGRTASCPPSTPTAPPRAAATT